MTIKIASIQRGEPLTLSLARTYPPGHAQAGSPMPLPSGWSLRVALKAAEVGQRVPAATVPEVAELSVTTGSGEDWLATLSGSQSEALQPGLYVLDGRIKDGAGATQIITDPISIQLLERVTAP